MRKTLLVAALGLSGILAPAQSTARSDYSFGLQLGSNLPQTTLKQYAVRGLTTSLDFTYNTGDSFRLRTEVGYSDNPIGFPANVLGVGARVRNWNVTENGVYEFGEGSFTFYVLGGLGAYRVTFALDSMVPVPVNGWEKWGGYYPSSSVAGTAEIASNTTTRFGYNGGIGLNFRLTEAFSVFVETRYQVIQAKPTVNYLSYTMGVRF